MAVWVNRGRIEVTLPDGWSGRLTTHEAVEAAAGFRNAIAQAATWAATWNPDTLTYGPMSIDVEAGA
jgi:hypothetical protein